MIFLCVKNADTKIQIQNTQIQHKTKCQKDPTCDLFLIGGLFKDIKNDIPMCQTRKYKNTKYKIHKYTNTAYDEVPERPNMWYICETRIVQGYLPSFAQLYKV